MNSTIEFTGFGISADAANTPMSASRGILALQGIGIARPNGISTNAPVKPRVYPSVVVENMLCGGWQHAALGATAFRADAPSAVLRAARFRNAHPATVIRSRQRCRLR